MAKKKASKAPPPLTETPKSVVFTPRSCLDCRHLVATIPVQARTGQLYYDGALVRCFEGYIVDGNNNPKIYKNVLRNGEGGSWREAWRTAETCPGFWSILDE